MAITLKTHKMLWGRAANRCAFPDCRRELVMDATATDDPAIIGVAAHIIAEAFDGPRGDSSLPAGQRDKYQNLILLCATHHALIDAQPNTYTAQMLLEMKATHEAWVRATLQGFDPEKQRDDEIYATYLEEWAERCDLENWRAWSSNVLAPQPSVSARHNDTLEELGSWLLGRIWPRRYLGLEAAFENFRCVLGDFLTIFHEDCSVNERFIQVRRFYRLREWDPPLYARLLREYNFRVALIEDLMLELTRAANYVCDHVRQYVDASYRLKEGAILVESGPYRVATYVTHRVEYRGAERDASPYKGLEDFMTGRTTRDFHFGDGVNAETSQSLDRENRNESDDR